MPALLAHLHVVDLTDLRGAFAGCLLTDLGADVIKAEPPAGDLGRLRPPFAGDVTAPDRSLPFLPQREEGRRGDTNITTNTRGGVRLPCLAEVVLSR